MDELVSSAKKEAFTREKLSISSKFLTWVLVVMVTLAQKKKMEGSKGQWKEFLKFHDKKFRASLSDPSRRNVDSLAAFLKTFTQDDDLKFFKKVLECHSNRDRSEKIMTSSLDSESTEERLVRMTLEHPQYPTDYSFPSFEEDWLIIKGGKKSKAVISDQMIAIDCEMVLCNDGSDALVRVCAVDRNFRVKIDEIVKPNKAIADYRTEITGISAKDLVGVSHSLKDVQKSIKRLSSHGAILVGHSLSNDLHALKLDHTRVIDTAFIFKYANRATTKKPSLSFLCKTMLHYELRKNGVPHNCLDDACAVMKLVLARLEGKIDDVIPDEGNEWNVPELLLHRIPINVRSEDLRSIIPGGFSLEVKVSKKSKNIYTAIATFKNQQEAIEAFDKLEGDLGEDSCGRPEKVVEFQLDSGASGALNVCKLAKGESVKQISKKRSGEDETTVVSKKLKTDEVSEQREDTNQCEMHLKEIERLKEELSQREQDVASLRKIIAALARKQGL